MNKTRKILLLIIFITAFTTISCDNYCMLSFGDYCEFNADEDGFHTYYVSNNGNDSNPGTNNLPMRNIYSAINHAKRLGKTHIKIKVSEGLYHTQKEDDKYIIIDNNMKCELYGGYPNHSWNDKDRDPAIYKSRIIDNTTSESTDTTSIMINDIDDFGAVIDGFEITCNKKESNDVYGIIVNNSSTIIKNNVIYSDFGTIHGVGIEIKNPEAPDKKNLIMKNSINRIDETISNEKKRTNTYSKGTTKENYGIHLLEAEAIILGNDISAGYLNSYRNAHGIHLSYRTSAIIIDNYVRGGDGEWNVGIFGFVTNVKIVNKIEYIDNEYWKIIGNYENKHKDYKNIIKGGTGTETTGIGMGGDKELEIYSNCEIIGNDIDSGSGLIRAEGINLVRTNAVIQDNLIEQEYGQSYTTYGIYTSYCNTVIKGNRRIESGDAIYTSIGIHNRRSNNIITDNVIESGSSELFSLGVIYRMREKNLEDQEDLFLLNNKIETGKGATFTLGVYTEYVNSIYIINNIISAGQNTTETEYEFSASLLEILQQLNNLLSGVQDNDIFEFDLFNSSIGLEFIKSNAKVYNNTIFTGLSNLNSFGVVASGNSTAEVINNIIFSTIPGDYETNVNIADEIYTLFTINNGIINASNNILYTQNDLAGEYVGINNNRSIKPVFVDLLGDDTDAYHLADNDWRLVSENNNILLEGAVNGADINWTDFFPKNDEGYLIDKDGNERPFPPNGWTMGAYQYIENN